MRLIARFCILPAWLICGCSSTPKNTSPDWIHQPTRIVDGGYIVYVGSAASNNPDTAQFKAEGLALEDLSNECSLIPKGARIEDRYLDRGPHDTMAYVKVALEFQECDQARHAVDPGEIRKIANVPFTEQLKKYQDLEETGEMPEKGEVASIEPPEQTPPPPERAPGWSDSTHFYVMRQYVAYQKEVVVLAPPTAYPPNAPATRTFISTIDPVAERIHTSEVNQPGLRTQAWSQVPDRPAPAMMRPASLAPRGHALMSRPVRPPANPGRQWARKSGGGARRQGQPGKPPPKKKRKRSGGKEGQWNH